MINGLRRMFQSAQQRRQHALLKCPPGPLQDYLAQPWPQADQALDCFQILALDFETTGLKPETDHLLSYGCVDLHNTEIFLNSAEHQLIHSTHTLEERNVAIHHITDAEKNSGIALQTAVDRLLNRLRGKVLLAHYATIETGFLHNACKNLYGVEVEFPVIDTFLLAKRRLQRHHLDYDPADLRLGQLRERYTLPAHFAHNALSDALATAELFLAQIADTDEAWKTPIGRLLS